MHASRLRTGLTLTAFALSFGVGSLAPALRTNAETTPAPKEPIRYLAFQIFTPNLDSPEMVANFPPPRPDFLQRVLDLRDRIGITGSGERQLGVVLGPLAFDDTDDDVVKKIDTGFTIARATGVAIGFHIDDSMFWGRVKELNAPNAIEWLDWRRTPATGRRLEWGPQATKIRPQLCFNSAEVRQAVADRAKLIGNEVAKGLQKLGSAHKKLFLGVIAGWETRIAADFDTGEYPGYCALTNAGYSASRPPADIDAARRDIVAGYIAFWAKSLADAGVPKGKIYSHIAFFPESRYRSWASFVPYLRSINFTPPSTAFCASCVPGLSVYPEPGLMEQWRDELKKRGNPPWASCEGAAINPADAAYGRNGGSVEAHLGGLFNNGAILVNLFGWGVGDADNPFRNAIENSDAIAAYRKFLRGEPLVETRG